MSVQHQEVLKFSMCVDRELLAELLERTGQARLRVAGASMSPTLRVGDTILVNAFTKASPVIGEFVTFVQGDRVRTHRVVALSGSRLITRGDANLHEDSPINPLDCLGRVVRVERNGRTLSVGPLRRKWSVMRYLCLWRFWTSLDPRLMCSSTGEA